MRTYLKNYIKEQEELLNKKHKYTQEEIDKFLIKISFFQHERLIHLLVTLFFSFFAIIFMCLGMISAYFLIIFAILIVFVICYIYHYFFLENAVQYLYKLYDRAIDKK